MSHRTRGPGTKDGERIPGTPETTLTRVFHSRFMKHLATIDYRQGTSTALILSTDTFNEPGPSPDRGSLPVTTGVSP